MGLSVHIESETGPLEHVLVHRPGDEVVRMTQHELEALLFDDILSPDAALREHDLMVEIIRGTGANVLEVTDLLRRALDKAPKPARYALLAEVCELGGAPELLPVLDAMAADELGRALVCGLRFSELDAGPQSLARLRRQLLDRQTMALAPVPNLMFMRDPCVSICNRVLVGRMATAARAREPLLVAFAIEHGGEVGAEQVSLDEPASRHPSFRRFEGGDALILSNKVLAIGCSERTSAQSIERVATLMFDEIASLSRVYAVVMPTERSVMHLDTILTQIDEKTFLGHAPAIASDKALPVVRLESGHEPTLVKGATMLDVLREELGKDVNLIACGGDDPLHQEREQWTDGANAFCMAPGHIILYARNVHTIAALRDQGYEEIAVHMVQTPDERAALIADGMKCERAVFSFPGSELSRARGGGRCLTMPLARKK